MFNKIVALYGVPRSGTSWLGQIIDSSPNVAFRYQPLFSYRFKNRILTESTKEEIDQFLYELYLEKNDPFLNQSEKREKGSYPVFLKNSDNPSILSFKECRYLYTIPILLEKYPAIKIISITRNPCDVLESWINASSEYNPEWDIKKEWQYAQSKNKFRPENYYGYYKWKEYIKLSSEMESIYPNNFIIVKYEDLRKNALSITKKLFEFCNIPFDIQTEKFIIESQNKTVSDPYSVYRGKNDVIARKYHLPQEIKDIAANDIRGFEEAKMLGY